MRRTELLAGLLVGMLAVGCSSSSVPGVATATGTQRTSSSAVTSSATSSSAISSSSRTTSQLATTTQPSTTSPSATADTTWVPTEANPDPSVDIPDIYIGSPTLYAQRFHFAAPDRVAYDRFPPVGGPHDPVWAACDGVVYTKPIRNEIMVHSLEHGAVWIAYNPQTLPVTDLATLTNLVVSTSYLVMTPYPDLDAPISLQSWGHQLKLDTADDPRVLQFVKSLLRNPYLTPEPNATCAQPSFDVDNPPPFDGSAPGPGAIPLDYQPPATTS